MSAQAAVRLNHHTQNPPEAHQGEVIDLLKLRKGKLRDQDRELLVINYRLKARKLGKSILRKWHARLDLEEVDSIVDLSLCEAVQRFDPRKGASFMTFLYYHLKGNLIRAVTSAAAAHSLTIGDFSTSRDEEKAVSATDIADSLTGSETMLPDEALLKKELVSLSQDACGKLDELERQVIERIYIKGEQLLDIAASLGYSRCHISRVKRKALETLQGEMREKVGEDAFFAQAEAEETNDIARGSHRRKIHRRRPRSKQARELRKGRKAA